MIGNNADRGLWSRFESVMALMDYTAPVPGWGNGGAPAGNWNLNERSPTLATGGPPDFVDHGRLRQIDDRDAGLRRQDDGVRIARQEEPRDIVMLTGKPDVLHADLVRVLLFSDGPDR